MMKQMSSKERLHRCFCHQEVDRPALYIRWGGLEGGERRTLDPTYADLVQMIEEQTDRKTTYNAESLLTPLPTKKRREPAGADFEREITTVMTPGGPLEQSHLFGLRGQPGYTDAHFLKDENDAEKYLSLPEPAIEGDLSPFFEAVRDTGERGIVTVRLGFNAASKVVELFGSEAFAILSIENRGLLHLIMERESRILKNLVRFLTERDVGPYFGLGGEEYIVPPLHGRRDFDDFNVRYDRPIADMIHEAGGRLHIHSHGSVKAVLDGFIEIGTDVLHPFEAPPLGDITPKEAKDTARGKLTLEGNIQVGDLYTKSTDVIREQVRGLIRDVFDDRRGLIVCPTASPYIHGEGQIYTENCRVLVEEVLSYSR